MTDYGDDALPPQKFKPVKAGDPRTIAVAIKDGQDADGRRAPKIEAAARGALAEKILQIAFENGIKVREDADLAEMLAEMELDSPVPTEALMAVAEILSYVYRANGQPDPFNAVLEKDSSSS